MKNRNKVLLTVLLGLQVIGVSLYAAASLAKQSITHNPRLDDEALDLESIALVPYEELSGLDRRSAVIPRCSPSSSRSTSSSMRVRTVSARLKAAALHQVVVSPSPVLFAPSPDAERLSPMQLLPRFSPSPRSASAAGLVEDTTINKIKVFLIAAHDNLSVSTSTGIKFTILEDIKEFLAETAKFELTRPETLMYRLDNIGMRFSKLRESIEAELFNINAACWDKLQAIVDEAEKLPKPRF
jgi:hypothetical protein